MCVHFCFVFILLGLFVVVFFLGGGGGGNKKEVGDKWNFFHFFFLQIIFNFVCV